MRYLLALLGLMGLLLACTATETTEPQKKQAAQAQGTDTAPGDGNSADPAMPAVDGKRLDVALSDLRAVGIKKRDVEIVGGGLFGVVDESNWKVCTQKPEPGAADTSGVRLVVRRACSAANASNDNSAAGEAGSETFSMPSLVGENLQDAQDELQSLGSYVLDQEDAKGLERFQVLDENWQVCGQQPQPGAEVPIEATVKLDVVKLSESCP